MIKNCEYCGVLVEGQDWDVGTIDGKDYLMCPQCYCSSLKPEEIIREALLLSKDERNDLIDYKNGVDKDVFIRVIGETIREYIKELEAERNEMYRQWVERAKKEGQCKE